MIPRVLALALGMGVLAVLVSLGTWQMHRLAWKEHLIATIEERIASAPRPLDEVERVYRHGLDVDYWPVEATGRFRHDGERYFFATWQGSSGYFVYTPFELADARVVLVNRGFVPFDRKDPATRPEGQVAGEVSIKGLARNPLAEKPSWAVPDNDLKQNIFYWKDLDAMAASAGLPPGTTVLPFFIDISAGEVPGGLPIGGVTLLEMPNSHLSYALTWYGLAGTLVCIYVAWFLRGRRAALTPPRP